MPASCYSGAAGIVCKHRLEHIFCYALQYHHIDWGIFFNILPGSLVRGTCCLRIILQRYQGLLLCRIEIDIQTSILIILTQVG